MIRLAGDLRPERLNTLLNALQRSVKQQEMVVSYLQLSGYIEDNDVTGEEKYPVSRALLLKKTGAASSVLNTLLQKKVLTQYEVTTSRLDNDAKNTGLSEIHQLNPQQQNAFNAICSSFTSSQQTLLHGVTSSGKTEVYIHLIKKYIDEGQQVLYLLPEIALTTQITDRLRQFFGNGKIMHVSVNEEDQTVLIDVNNLTKGVVVTVKETAVATFTVIHRFSTSVSTLSLIIRK
jgi:primosomal protein N' (replication factor Y)